MNHARSDMEEVNGVAAVIGGESWGGAEKVTSAAVKQVFEMEMSGPCG